MDGGADRTSSLSEHPCYARESSEADGHLSGGHEKLRFLQEASSRLPNGSVLTRAAQQPPETERSTTLQRQAPNSYPFGEPRR